MSQRRIKRRILLDRLTGNHLPKLDRLIRRDAVLLNPGVHHVVVSHDDWCPILNGGTVCGCDPEVRHATAKESEEYDAELGGSGDCN